MNLQERTNLESGKSVRTDGNQFKPVAIPESNKVPLLMMLKKGEK